MTDQPQKKPTESTEPTESTPASTPLTEQEIFEKVAAAVAEQKSCDVEKVKIDSKFEDLEVDSLDAMEILFELEDALDVSIPDQAARSMRTVHDVVDGLGKLIRGEEIVLPDPPAEPPAPPESTGEGSAPSSSSSDDSADDSTAEDSDDVSAVGS